MADVTCPLTFEDHAALVSETSTLSAELQAILKDAKHTTKIDHGYLAGYETVLSEAEARALLAYAESNKMRRLESDLRQELNGFERRKREGNKR